ncbi:response regulator transcription factor [Micromonospora sp. CPCC 205539]|uniref:response regulator transcription factor n=1 Tax=Micromonospora sp. CPCC 205539 TaxID=3122408 RepID=UPI002FF362EA
MSIRVLVCDELPIVRDGLRTLLGSEPDVSVVDTSDSGNHAIMLARTHRVDVIVTGLKLRGISAVELINKINGEKLNPRPRFVVFASTDSDDLVSSVFQAGVNGILMPDATWEEVAAAVRAAAVGQTTLAPQIADRLVDWFRRRQPSPDEVFQPAVSTLTPRERQVLLLMADGKSTDEVAAELSIGLTTVRTHVYRLRCKLNVKDRAQLVSFAYRAGLMQPA